MLARYHVLHSTPGYTAAPKKVYIQLGPFFGAGRNWLSALTFGYVIDLGLAFCLKHCVNILRIKQRFLLRFFHFFYLLL